jgi:hypothetical protein
MLLAALGDGSGTIAGRLYRSLNQIIGGEHALASDHIVVNHIYCGPVPTHSPELGCNEPAALRFGSSVSAAAMLPAAPPVVRARGYRPLGHRGRATPGT